MGAFAIVNMTNREIHLKQNNIRCLYALGMSKKKISYSIIRQKIRYTVIGLLLSWIPVAVFQVIHIYIQKRYMVGIGMEYLGHKPWYQIFPYNYEVLQQPVAAIVCGVFLAGVLLVIVSSIPAIKYINRQIEQWEYEAY